MTSNGYTAGPGQGVISAKPSVNPALYNANTVSLHYCSSDTWVGNRLGVGSFNAADSSTWNFEGRRIAIAQIQSVRELVPAFASATNIVLGGTSSGGVGVTLLANDLIPIMPPMATVVLVNDAGFSLDIGQYDRSLHAPFVFQGHPNTFETQLQQRIAYWNARGDATCDNAAVTPNDHANCMNTAFVLQNGFISVPSFVANSQIDTAQITQELCWQQYGYCPVSHNPASAQGMYAVAFGGQMATAIAGVGTQASYSSFAPDQYLHVILNNDAQFDAPSQFPSGGIAARDAFDDWLANPWGPATTLMGNAPGVQ